jgi:DNA-binding response OmpR family regulator
MACVLLSARRMRRDETQSGGRWALVADRDEAAARGVAAALARLGLWVYPTPRGQEAMRLARVQPLALAVVDERLADMPGHVLAQALRRCDAELPLVMTASASEPDGEVRARSIGIVHYAPKPLDLRALQAVAEHASRAREHPSTSPAEKAGHP